MNPRSLVLASVATSVASAAINVSQQRQIQSLQRMQAVPVSPVSWIIPVTLAAAAVAIFLALPRRK